MTGLSPRPAVPPLCLMLLCALVSFGGCRKERGARPAEPTSRTTPEYQRASEAMNKRIPTEGVPGGAGAQGVQKALQNSEAAQDRYERRADEVAGAQ